MEIKKTFEWIKNIIDSCTDDFHFDSVDRLIDLFSEKLEKKDSNDVMISELRAYRTWKWNNTI